MVEIAKNHGISNTFVMVCAMILIPIVLFFAYQFVQMITKEGADEAAKAAKLAEKKAKKAKTKRPSGSKKD